MRRLLPVLILLLSIPALSATAPSGRAASPPRARRPLPLASPRADVSDFEAGADSNRTWPAGWRRGGNLPSARVELAAPGHRGGRSVRLSTMRPEGYLAIVRDLPDSLREGAVAVRLTAWIRTEGAARASMWVHLLTSRSTLSSDEASDRWPKGTTGWTRYEILMPVLPEVQTVTFGFRLAGEGSAWVDDASLEALRPEEIPPSSRAAAAYLDAALDSICRRTVLTSQLNWGVLKRAARTQMLGARSTAGTYDALLYAVHRLDPDGELLRPDGAAQAGSPEGYFPLAFLLPAESGAGVIDMPACNAESRALQIAFADTTRRAIARLHANHARGWLVDLRRVTGGEIAPAIAGLGPLLGEGTLFGWQRPDGRRGRWTQHHGLAEYSPGAAPECRLASVVAPELELPDAPVAVLIGPLTSGAGEAIALAFRGRPGTRLFGETTAGRAQARERIRLSDGAQLRFATGFLTDRFGKMVGGAIPPDDSLSATLPVAGPDSLMTVALQWLRARADATH